MPRPVLPQRRQPITRSGKPLRAQTTPQDDSGAARRRDRDTSLSKVVLLSLRQRQSRHKPVLRVVAPSWVTQASRSYKAAQDDDNVLRRFPHDDLRPQRQRGRRRSANNQLKQPPARLPPRPSPQINKQPLRPCQAEGNILRGIIRQ